MNDQNVASPSEGDVHPDDAVEAAEHMANRIRAASALAAQHVGMPVVLWPQPPDVPQVDFSDHLTGIYMHAVRHSAWQLLWDAYYLCAGTGYDGPNGDGSDGFANAIRWLAEVAHEYGILDGENPSEFRGKYPPPAPDWGDNPVPEIEGLLPAGQWPSTAHLRLHYLAGVGHGWFCRDCGIGLIDVCRDDDTMLDAAGRRVIRPGCGKRLPTRDHRIPQALNGSHGPDNLDLVCRSCNSTKGAS